MARASVSDVPWMPLSGGVPGISHWEEDPGEDPGHAGVNTSRLCHLDGLGIPRDPPGRAAGSVLGEGCLGVPDETAVPMTWLGTSRGRWMDGWIGRSIKEGHIDVTYSVHLFNNKLYCSLMSKVMPSTLKMSCYTNPLSTVGLFSFNLSSNGFS